MKKKNPKNRSNKIHLVFNEEKRKEFLTGFHKRKLQRKKKAQEELKQQLKDEKKRLKSEAKESYKKLVVSYRPLPEVESLLAEEYEDDDVTVKVVELSTNEIAKQNNWIGANQPMYESQNESETNFESEREEIPGMELKPKRKIEDKVKKPEFKSKKEIKKVLKKQATKNVQKSKPYQIKNKLERQKQKKKSLQQKRLNLKTHKKMDKRSKRNRSLQVIKI